MGQIRKQGHDVAGRGRCTLSGNGPPSNGRSPIGGGEAVVRVRGAISIKGLHWVPLRQLVGPPWSPSRRAAWPAACLPGTQEQFVV